MTHKNKFGFAPVEESPQQSRRDRAPGPMGAAVRDVAENLTETTEAKVAQRRRNAEDAKAFRTAQEEGRVLVRLPVGNLYADDLPRDRMELDVVAASEEMEELKASIKERGQKEPIEVYIGEDGRYQIKKGWRRVTALRQLFNETGDDAFSTVSARVDQGGSDHMDRYIDMVEENVIREDLSFAEMAQVAISAAQDDRVPEADPMALVPRLYGALHKTKRSYIRSFVTLLTYLGDSLMWPKDVGRNVGLDVVRGIRNQEHADQLRARLRQCRTPEEQARELASFIAETKGNPTVPAPKREPKQKFEFYVGTTKITAREGECRIVSKRDFATIPKDRLEHAIKAFEDALKND